MTKEQKMVASIKKVYSSFGLTVEVHRITDYWYIVSAVDDRGKEISYVVCRGTICYTLDWGDTFSERMSFN